MKKNVTLTLRRPAGAALPAQGGTGGRGGVAVDYATGAVTYVDDGGAPVLAPPVADGGAPLVWEGRALLAPPRDADRVGLSREGEPRPDVNAVALLPKAVRPMRGDAVTVTTPGYVQRGVVEGYDVAARLTRLRLDPEDLAAEAATP